MRLLAILLSLVTTTAYAEAYRLEVRRPWASRAPGIRTTCGTATPISRGLLLTAAHNLVSDTEADSPNEKIVFKKCVLQIDGEWREANLLRLDEELDLALLSCDQAKKGVEIAAKDAVDGGRIRLLGSKRGRPMAEYVGVVKQQWYKGTFKTLMAVEFDHGDSGGAVIDSEGKLVGIAICGLPKNGDIDPEFGQFAPVSVLRTFLEKPQP